MATSSEDRVRELVQELTGHPNESEWLEFKENNGDPQAIGEYISALANSAALHGAKRAYMVWGVDDKTHKVVGTRFDPSTAKKGKEELKNWLHHELVPSIGFEFYQADVNGKRAVLLEIEPAVGHVVRMRGEAYIRIGSYKKRLKDHPAVEAKLWQRLNASSFEEGIAAEGLAATQVLDLLDAPSFFSMLDVPLPSTTAKVLEALRKERIVTAHGAGKFDITNLGAILIAKELSAFPFLARKNIRFIRYRGMDRTDPEREWEGHKGYGIGFEPLLEFIAERIPTNEVIEKALRRTVPLYPPLAVRELIANALVHQDFSIGGAGPMIELFEDRLEITSPGTPLVETKRLLDAAPQSRNEKLASHMRRMGICEERGSGIDKVVFQTEFHQLPAPDFTLPGEATCAVLFAPRPLTKMDRSDRVRATYLHACLRRVNRGFMTNTSLRERFGLNKENSALASKLIKEAVEDGFVRPFDENAAKRLMKYVPYWG